MFRGAAGPLGSAPVSPDSMLDPVARVVKDRLLAPVARAVGMRVHPNALSLLGFAVGLGCAYLAARAAYLPALALWLCNRVLDGLDGLVARNQRRASDFGGYVDILLDFAVYALIPIALAYSVPARPAVWLALAALLGAFYVNAASWMYLSALLEKRAAGAAARGGQTSVVMPGGLIEGTETILFFALFLLFPHALAPLFLTLTLLLAATVLQRVLWAARAL